MKNTILLRRKTKLIVAPEQNQLPAAYLATAMRKLHILGYTFSAALIERVSTLSVSSFVSLYQQTSADLKQMIGAHVVHKQLFPNFPDEIMDTEESDLFLYSYNHYIGSLDETVEEFRWPLFDEIKLKVINLGEEEEFEQIIKNLIDSKTSISQTDKEDIKYAISSYEDVSVLLPEEIKLKENVGYVVNLLLENDKAQVRNISKYFKTATDVLRLATVFSGGDANLAYNVHFKKFKRSERRMFLNLLENANNITEDMLRYRERWIRLGEILHPSEYKNQFFKTKEAFSVLRDSKKFETFTSKLEAALLNKDIDTAVSLLKTRPGEFARRLDQLLRNSNDPISVVESFREVAVEVATPVLLQISTHFQYRNQETSVRTFFIKGNVANLKSIENKLSNIEEEARVRAVEIAQQALVTKFSNLPSLGKVYLDDNLDHYNVPFSQRSASKSLRQVSRGSRFDAPEAKTVRMFLWWKQSKGQGSVDLDLSAVVYDTDWKFKRQISFTSLVDKQYGMVHSGDIRQAPHGASEFIDFDVEKVLEQGGRYVVMSVNSYSNVPYIELPECFAGWMSRDSASGNVYEPSTVVDKFDITSDSRISIPFIYDLVDKKVIWTDLSMDDFRAGYSMVDGNEDDIAKLSRSMVELKKPTLYELLYLHSVARGELVENIEDAEVVFSVENGTQFDIEKISSEYLV
ncbi:hypothetical protein D3C81_96280 [compost metagenome]